MCVWNLESIGNSVKWQDCMFLWIDVLVLTFYYRRIEVISFVLKDKMTSVEAHKYFIMSSEEIYDTSLCAHICMCAVYVIYIHYTYYIYCL